MIQVDKLTKQYGDLLAVDGVSFTAAAGRIFGLLGPNGAGKSTTLGCISGLHPPTSGRVTILGHDAVREPVAARRCLGVVPQELALYEDLSARENLHYWGGLYGLRGAELKGRVHEILERIGLADRAGDPVKEYSGGMKRRLNLGCGIVHEPRVVLLDEPTVGVDPQSRERVLDLVRELAAGGACVVYTTHYMEEAEALCDHLAIIDGGRVLAEGTLQALRELSGERDLLRFQGAFDPAAVRARFLQAGEEALAAIEVSQVDGEHLTLSLPHASRRLPAVLEALTGTGAEVRETTLTQPNLESLFIKLTGKELRQ
jgi:ABC-2 type transport system ATP-binding protein